MRVRAAKTPDLSPPPKARERPRGGNHIENSARDDLTSSAVEVDLLGPLRVRIGESVVAVAGDRARRLLAALALNAPRAVPTEALVELVWGDDAPDKPANALQAQVSKLRRLLPPGTLVTRNSAYELCVEPDAVDVHRFDRLVRESSDALQEGRPGDALAALDAALALWRGRPLVELDHPDVTPEVTRLTALHVVAQERRAEALLELDRAGEAAAALDGLTAAHPTRERLWELRMTALYRSGRQADALRAFQEARAVLVEQLGLEPGAGLRALEAAILTQDEALLASDLAPSAPEVVRRGNLPNDLNRFVGRVHEESRVRELLRDHRLVTLVGTGGAGKTRLALAAARTFDGRDGAWFAELASVQDGEGVPTAVATGLGLAALSDPSRRASATSDPIAGVTGIRDFVGDRELLLVLDNCEHVIHESAALVDTLLRACPQLRVLATSREGLGIPGEMLFSVPPLARDDAVALFIDRAASLAPSFTVDDPRDRSLVAEICERLDGLPLAIELAAARVRLLPLRDLRDRLDDRFRLLTGGSRVALPRQQTLRAVVDWSYDLLDDAERVAFARLSAFAGGCTLSDAEEVLAGDGVDLADVADHLGRLVDKSLVIAVHRGPHVRYRQLQTLTFYGREKLAASGEADAVRARHAAVFVRLALDANEGLRGKRQAAMLARLGTEFDNLRAALEFCLASGDADGAVAIAEGAVWYSWLRGDLSEAQQWLVSALALPGAVDPRRRVLAQGWLQWLRAMENRPEAVDDLRAVAADAIALDDPMAAGRVHLLLGHVVHQLRAGDDGDEIFDRAEALLRKADDRWALGLVLTLRAFTHTARGALDAAVASLTEALEHVRSVGDGWAEGLALTHVAEIAEARGDYAAARHGLTQAMTAFEASGSNGFKVIATAQLGSLAALEGDFVEADRLHELAVRQVGDSPLPGVVAQVLLARAFSLRRAGDLDRTEALLREAIASSVPRHPPAIAFAHNSLGFVLALRGDPDGAEREHLAALVHGAGGDPRWVALSLEGLAGVAALRGCHDRAAFLLGAADAARRSVGLPLPAGERVDVDRTSAASRVAIGDDAFDRAFAWGARVPLDPLVAGLLAG